MSLELRLLSLEIARLRGGVFFLGDGGSALHDHFDVLDGVDLTLTDADTSSAGEVKSESPSLSNLIDDMTGNSSPSPFVASASNSDSWSGGGSPWNAFDRNNSTGWFTNTTTGRLEIDLGSTPDVGSFKLRSRDNYSSTYNGFPVDFTFEGSYDGTNWTVIETYTDVSWSNNELKDFVLSGVQDYQHYAIDVTEGSTGNIIIAAFELYGASGHDDMELISKSFEAESVPSTMSAIVLYKGNATINTDLILELSRDDGVNWTVATLVDNFTDTDGFDVLSAIDVDVTSQPSDTKLKYRLTTANGATAEVGGVSMWCES